MLLNCDGWHHRLNVHGFEQVLRDGEGQGSLAWGSPWSREELDLTEQLNNNKEFSRLRRWLNGQEPPCQCRRHRFDPWVWKIPWRRKWQPLPVFLLEKFHEERSLVGYSPWVRKESDTAEHTHKIFILLFLPLHIPLIIVRIK